MFVLKVDSNTPLEGSARLVSGSNTILSVNGSDITVSSSTTGGTSLKTVGVVGQPFSYQVQTTGKPTSYMATGLPSGLSINSSTGVISGIPTTTSGSPFNVGLTISNATGSASSTLQIIINNSNSWQVVGSLNTARDGYGIIKLFTGKVLIIGGHTSGSNFTATCELYDPVTDTWSNTGSMSRANGEGTYITLQNNKVLAIGGYNTNFIPSTTCEIYDPELGTWSLTGSLATARTDGFACWLLSNGKVLVAGGITTSGGAATNTSEIYDPVAGTWSSGPNLPFNMSAMAFASLGDGRPLLCGGVDRNTTTILSTTLTYDVVNNVWVTQPNLPVAITFDNCRGGVTLLDGNVFVYGGNPINTGSQSTGYIFMYATNTWKTTATNSNPQNQGSIFLTLTGKILHTGPRVGVGYGLITLFYDPISDTWATLNSLNDSHGIPLYGNVSVVLNDGRALLPGGQTSGADTAITEVFSLVPVFN